MSSDYVPFTQLAADLSSISVDSSKPPKKIAGTQSLPLRTLATNNKRFQFSTWARPSNEPLDKKAPSFEMSIMCKLPFGISTPLNEVSDPYRRSLPLQINDERLLKFAIASDLEFQKVGASHPLVNPTNDPNFGSKYIFNFNTEKAKTGFPILNTKLNLPEGFGWINNPYMTREQEQQNILMKSKDTKKQSRPLPEIYVHNSKPATKKQRSNKSEEPEKIPFKKGTPCDIQKDSIVYGCIEGSQLNWSKKDYSCSLNVNKLFIWPPAPEKLQSLGGVSIEIEGENDASEESEEEDEEEGSDNESDNENDANKKPKTDNSSSTSSDSSSAPLLPEIPEEKSQDLPSSIPVVEESMGDSDTKTETTETKKKRKTPSKDPKKKK